jgi:hypothetical protein
MIAQRQSRVSAAKGRERMAALKAAPCMDCGYSYPTECMDFDHVRGRKVFMVNTQNVLRRWAIVLKEVAKCDLVCANCHRTRTKNRMKEK